MYVGTLSFDLLLGDVRSLKEKRSAVRPIVAELQRKFSVSAAEVGDQDLYRRCEIGVAMVSGTPGTSRRCWTGASGWWPPGPRWSCCPYGGGSTARMTEQPGHRTVPRRTSRRNGPVADNARARKLADRIQVVVAETLDRRIKDPRLGFVTITDARVTGDLREATVFYTVYGDDEERAASAAALESAKGVLRSEVGRQTGVRFTPTLAFVPDALPDNARTIDDLLDKARNKDAEVRQASAGAKFAGEADPYRKPGEDEADERDEDDTAE